MTLEEEFASGTPIPLQRPMTLEEEFAQGRPIEEHGLFESLGRGAGQGLSMGLGDELTGAFKAGTSDETYQHARDAARAANEDAKEQHPWAYGVGEFAGSVLPSMVLPGGKAASAALGAVSGLGHSTADVTTGDVGGAAIDTGIGAALGGLGHLAGQGLGAAAGAIKGAALRASSGIQKAVEGRAGEIARAAVARQWRDAYAPLRNQVVLAPESTLAEGAGRVAAKAAEMGRKAMGAFEPPSMANEVDKARSALMGNVAALAEGHAQDAMSNWLDHFMKGRAALAGGGLGYALGGKPGAIVGALMGRSVASKLGQPNVQLQILNHAIAAPSAAVQRFAPALMAAKMRGSEALLAAHATMMQRNADYRDAMQKQQDGAATQ